MRRIKHVIWHFGWMLAGVDIMDIMDIMDGMDGMDEVDWMMKNAE